MYCRRCGTLLPQGVVICPECGTRQRRQANVVHCASCRARVPMGLTVCPQCGRDVRPAGPRWGLWLAGLVALVLFGLWGLGKLPLEQAGQEIATVRSKLTSLVQVLGPVTRPMQPLETPQVVGQVDAVPTPAALAPTSQPTEDEAALTPAVLEAPPAEATLSPEDIATPSDTPSPEATPTPIPTEQPTEAPTLTSTPSPAPLPPTAAPTATQAAATKAPPAGGKPTTYAIRSGDTLLVIANRFNVTLDALLAANNLSVRSVLRIGQQLVIPASGAPIQPISTPSPTPLPPAAAPTATQAPATKAPPASGKATTYTIQSGDSLMAIANRFNITLDALLAANKLSVKSVLRIGQQLVIPASGAPIPPTQTPRPQPTATPTPAPPTPAPVSGCPGFAQPR